MRARMGSSSARLSTGAGMTAPSRDAGANNEDGKAWPSSLMSMSA